VKEWRWGGREGSDRGSRLQFVAQASAARAPIGPSRDRTVGVQALADLHIGAATRACPNLLARLRESTIIHLSSSHSRAQKLDYKLLNAYWKPKTSNVSKLVKLQRLACENAEVSRRLLHLKTAHCSLKTP
jgi:hypothetical protein